MMFGVVSREDTFPTMDLGGSSTPYASSVTARRENDAGRGALLSIVSRITEKRCGTNSV